MREARTYSQPVVICTGDRAPATLRTMRYVLILAAIAAAGFAYKRSRAEPPPAVEVQGDKTPAANAENRVNNLSGQAPDPF
jgi:hypothetical protein